MEILCYTTASGNSPVERFVEGLSQSLQEDFFLALDRLRLGEILEMPLSKPLFNIALGLHELCFKELRNIYRSSILSSAGMQFIWFMSFKKRPRPFPIRIDSLFSAD